MTIRKKVLLVTVLIITAAIAVVLGVGYLTGRQPSEFDGTLVKSVLENSIEV